MTNPQAFNYQCLRAKDRLRQSVIIRLIHGLESKIKQHSDEGGQKLIRHCNWAVKLVLGGNNLLKHMLKHIKLVNSIRASLAKVCKGG